jgi:hypothetical protein
MKARKQTHTVRFASIVKDAGTPVQVDLWADPKSDPKFKKAISGGRVMTIDQLNTGTRRDIGLVGFQPGANRSWLVFPRSIAQFKDQRVIGIDYDLIEDAPTLGPLVKTSKNSRAKSVTKINHAKTLSKNHEPQPPALKTFVVKLRYKATAEVEFRAEAISPREARAHALENARTPDFTTGIVTKKVVSIRPVEN